MRGEASVDLLTSIRCDSGFNLEVMWSAMVLELGVGSCGKTRCLSSWYAGMEQVNDTTFVLVGRE